RPVRYARMDVRRLLVLRDCVGAGTWLVDLPRQAPRVARCAATSRGVIEGSSIFRRNGLARLSDTLHNQRCVTAATQDEAQNKLESTGVAFIRFRLRCGFGRDA